MSMTPFISSISRVPNALTLPKSIFHDAYPRRYSKLSISPLLHGSLSHYLSMSSMTSMTSMSRYLFISLSQVSIARAFRSRTKKAPKIQRFWRYSVAYYSSIPTIRLTFSAKRSNKPTGSACRAAISFLSRCRRGSERYARCC